MEDKIIVVDTDVIINHVNDQSLSLTKYLKLQAKKEVSLVVSSVTVFEYYSSDSLVVQTKEEETNLMFFYFFKKLVNEEIAKKAASINRSYKLFGKIGLGDLFIGATTLYLQGSLLTENKKHFKLIPGIRFAK